MWLQEEEEITILQVDIRLAREWVAYNTVYDELVPSSGRDQEYKPKVNNYKTTLTFGVLTPSSGPKYYS